MGPVSKAALIKAQEADTEFKSAVLEELQGIREAINKLSGRKALDDETVNERIETIESRLTTLERAGSSGQGTQGH